MDYIKYLIDPRIKPSHYLIGLALALILVFVGGILVYFYKKGAKKIVAGILLLLFLFFVYSSTVFSRETKEVHTYQWLPFWSYLAINESLKDTGLFLNDMFWFNVLNLIMLMPIGIIFPILLNTNRKKTVCLTTLFGFFVSVSIELFQLSLKKGLFEFDDMIHNTLGVFLMVWLITFFRREKE